LANATIGAQAAVAMPHSRKNPRVARRAPASKLDGAAMTPVYAARAECTIA
jgi:hypothetical protein